MQQAVMHRFMFLFFRLVIDLQSVCDQQLFFLLFCNKSNISLVIQILLKTSRSRYQDTLTLVHQKQCHAPRPADQETFILSYVMFTFSTFLGTNNTCTTCIW